MDYQKDKQQDFFNEENTDEINDTPIIQKRSSPSSAKNRTENVKATVKQGEKILRTEKSKRHSAHNKKGKDKSSFSLALSNPDSALNIALTYVWAFVAIYFAFCLYSNSGAVFGHFTRFILFGLFSSAAYAIPLFMLLQGLSWRNDISKKAVLKKIISSFIALLFISALLYLPKNILNGASFSGVSAFFSTFFNWENPVSAKAGGGLLGSCLGWCLYSVFGKVGTILIFTLVILLYLIFFFNFNPKSFALKSIKLIKSKMYERKGKRDAKKLTQNEDADDIYEQDELSQTDDNEQDAIAEPKQRHRVQARRVRHSNELPSGYENVTKHEKFKNNLSEYSSFDDAVEDVEDVAQKKLKNLDGVSSSSFEEIITDRSAFSQGDETDEIPIIKKEVPVINDEDEVVTRQTLADIRRITKIENTPNKKDASKTNVKSIVLSNEDADNDDNSVSNTNKVATVKVQKGPKYAFPPFSLLEKSSAIQDSLLGADNDPIAIKLRQTLKNFNVNTVISNVSRGPRITRYELVPDTGIRIRAIANLVDDISMALATAGIRIEAPIPGKAAVGVEVPNASPIAVRMRSLLDSETFKSSPAKTTVCLGADIGGDPVYADISKMPHLLIAGATGMGKSVCINTIITSILYKARPDEVKLILIDPKKVELNVYSGIPHLLVPVVSDPSQAAGALAWAVNEMESRFDRIEAEGVRNIKGYNKAIENDPSKEPMCQIVIIIDELADLMMSSPDSVETSICRIAQKARAAGIHLIIGTQRPSVDVITGLIKANIPSRIAFHVSSQIDSRTILDTAGAEKLLNNGDMLFYPAGIPKPKRIQGAFVDDDEVERVTSFLKQNSKGAVYDDTVIEEIKKAAEKCAQSGKRRSEGDGDDSSIDGILDDPKFNDAIEVAFDNNKISTSLLQRKLSIGFGRAAKYIDVMCEMGIVSEPDGQKPREILMTRSEYYERKNRLSE